MRADDLAPLLVPPKTPELSLRQGVIVAWDSAAGTNRVDVGGTALDNLPVLSVNAVVQLSVGDVVTLIRSRSQYFIIGRIATLGDERSKLPDDFITSTDSRLDSLESTTSSNTSRLNTDESTISSHGSRLTTVENQLPVSPIDWTNVPLSGGATTGGSSMSLHQICRYATRQVELQFDVDVSGVSSNTVIGTVPSWAMPTLHDLRFPTAHTASGANLSNAHIDIQTSGAVLYSTANAGSWSWLALNVTYRPDQ